MLKIVWPLIASFLLLSIAGSALAGGETAEKPDDWNQRLEKLRAVPYVSFSETMADKSQCGVVHHDPEKAYQGYNLYTVTSSGEAMLLDMEGREVNRWKYPPPRIGILSHALLLDNGDLLVAKEHRELLRFNWNGEVMWRKPYTAHHDIALAPDGSFYVLTGPYRDHRGLTVRFDAIVHITADGEEIERWFTYDHLDELKASLDTRSFLDTVLDSVLGDLPEDGSAAERARLTVAEDYRYDYFHMNTISLLPSTALGEKDSRFRSGNILVCSRHVNQIAILEKETYEVLWAWGEGQLEWPHHPTLLENGHILIFDNGVERKYSRVVELDPITEQIVWEYKADPPETFFTFAKGSAQRLPNGNTLICDGDNGRVFEVTREGEVVWMWLTPVFKDGRREVVYRMTRVPVDQVNRLLQKTGLQED